MISAKDLDRLRSSDARNGPMFISEDLIRCLLMYRCDNFPSVVEEINFLYEHYGDSVQSYLQDKQFIISEYVDIVWAYYDIPDEWARLRYFNEKACFLKSLRDNLILFNLYDYYKDLEPFEMLDSAFDVVATLKDLSDSSPISWVNVAPVTALHRQMQEDAKQTLAKLPNKFGCLGYNFTKTLGKVCMRSTCGLSLYREAEFDFSADGIILVPETVMLLDYKRIANNITQPLVEKASIPELKSIVSTVKDTMSPVKRNNLDPESAIYELFAQSIKGKKFPFVDDKIGLTKLVKLFSQI